MLFTMGQIRLIFRYVFTELCTISSPTRSETQSLYLWPSGFFCCRPGCLEFSVNRC